MPHYYDFKPAQNGGFVLFHSDGVEILPSRIVAEQKLLSSINNWAAENTDKAKQEMELLTRLVRVA